MSTQTVDFLSITAETATQFLRSVLVVDDKAYEPPDAEEVDQISDLKRPEPVIVSDPEGAKTERPAGDNEKAATPQKPDAGPDVHVLSVKALSDSFADVGLFCTVLKPSPTDLDQLIATSTQGNGLANRADVVILDWVLHSYKEGEKTLELIHKLVGSKDRTRLILIYTGESNLLEIANKIRQKLDLALVDDPNTKGATEVRTKATMIVVYAKPGARVIKQLESKVISAEQIPSVVVKDFASSISGLLSTFALKSMAVLRHETYDILKKFPPSLDAAFITHKVLKNPEDAAGHILPLVVAEIQAVLEDNDVTAAVSNAALVSWLKRRVEDGLKFNIGNTPEDEAKAGLLDLIEKTPSGVAGDQPNSRFVQNFLKSKGKATGEVVVRLTDLLDGKVGSLANEQLAVLMSVRSRYGAPPPHLSLGTIIREAESGRYLMCVQPRCDSVRLKELRSFPFLPMQTDDKNYQFIVPQGDGFVKLIINGDPHKIEKIPFQPWSDQEREVLARLHEGALYFKSGDRERSFQWVAELKSDHAQRVAVRLGNRISRVGLNESEWLRIIARESDQDPDNA